MSDSAIPEDVGELEMIHGTRAVLEMLAGKWNVAVLYLLATGTRRYNQVLYEVGEISKKTLTHTLRSLERDGLVARRVGSRPSAQCHVGSGASSEPMLR
jgi:DNA-binding HxlR family transcriptional regulator